MFRLLRYFSIASLVSMVLAAIVLGMLHQLFEKSHLLRYGESQNVALAPVFSNNTWPKFRSFANTAKGLDADTLRRQPEIARLNRSVRDAVRNTPTVRVTNLPARRAHAVLDGCRADRDQQRQRPRLSLGNAGRAAKQNHPLRQVDSLDGELVNRDVLSSYHPAAQQRGRADRGGDGDLYRCHRPGGKR